VSDDEIDCLAGIEIGRVGWRGNGRNDEGAPRDWAARSEAGETRSRAMMARDHRRSPSRID
jgi:hypothetical protein